MSASPESPAQRNKIGIALLLLLIGISGIGPVTLNGVLPANSVIMREFAASYGVTQLILTVFMIAALLSQIILGSAADRHGRRPVMIFGISVFVLGSVLCALAPSIELLLAARFVQGFGGAVCLFLPRTIVRDVYPQDRAASVIGYMTTAMMVAPLFGPAIGGWTTDEFSWRFMHWGLAVLGICCVGLSLWILPETRAERAASESQARPGLVSSASILFRMPAFVAYTVMLCGSVGIYYSFLGGAPYIGMESRGFSASEYGAWFSVVAIGYLSGNLVAGRFSERLGGARMITLGLIPLFGGVALFWLLSSWQSLLGMFIPMQLVAFSNGMSLPNLISGSMSVRHDLSGSASGVSGSLQTGFGALLTICVGYLLPFSDYWLWVIISASAVLTLIGFVLLRKATA